MVVGDSGDIGSAYQVQAAVPNVSVEKLVPHESNRSGGCPHPVKLRMRSGVLQNALVRGLKTSEQQGLRIAPSGFGKNFLDRLDRNAAGFLSTFVAAHPVRYYSQPPLAREFFVRVGLPVSVVVLVIFPLATNVTQAGQLNSGPYSHRTSSTDFEQLNNRLPATQGLSTSRRRFGSDFSPISTWRRDYTEPPRPLFVSEVSCYRIRNCPFPDDICHRELVMISTGVFASMLR
jgi:hypothetical protein